MDCYQEMFLASFLQSMEVPFSFGDFCKILEYMKVPNSKMEATLFLEDNPNVFELQKDLYITRCGMFSNSVFSIKPSKKEIETQTLFLGTRVLPFFESEIIPAFIAVEYKGKKLKHKITKVPKTFALDLYKLAGYEYACQYIAADPANDEYDVAELDFVLPSMVKLTGVSLKPLIENGFQYGDRLLCSIQDWKESMMKIEPIFQNRENPFLDNEKRKKRLEWNKSLETALQDTFEKYGPLDSIDMQLALTFLNHNSKLTISCPNPGSILEYLESSKKIALEPFGMETRLWFKGQEVPVIGKWSKLSQNSSALLKIPSVVPDFVIDNYIIDFFAQKKTCIEDLLSDVVYSHSELSPEFQDATIQRLQKRAKEIKKQYNWFADYTKAEARHQGLLLYASVTSLLYEIQTNTHGIENFPQQQLAILLQISKHLQLLLKSLLEKDPNSQDIQDISMTLDGMNFHFGQIKDDIQSAIDEQHRKSFCVV